MEFLDDTFKNFSKLITDNIKIGLVGTKPICFLDYKGEYFKENGDGSSSKHNGLFEIIEDVINTRIIYAIDEQNIQYDNDYKLLVTRQSGTDDLKRWPPNTRISILRVRDNKIFVWTPTFNEIFEALKHLISRPDNKYHIGNIKLINERLVTSKDFSVSSVINLQYEDYTSSISIGKLKNYIPVVAFYSLIKQILISEDIRYPGQYNFGRYLTITALFDFIYNDKGFDEIKLQYKLPD